MKPINGKSPPDCEVNPYLYKLKETGEKNMKKYLKSFAETGTYGACKLDTMFANKKDQEKFDSIENKTKEQITADIRVIASFLPQPMTIPDFDQKLNQAMKKKTTLLELYYQIKELIDDQLSQLSDPDDD